MRGETCAPQRHFQPVVLIILGGVHVVLGPALVVVDVGDHILDVVDAVLGLGLDLAFLLQQVGANVASDAIKVAQHAIGLRRQSQDVQG